MDLGLSGRTALVLGASGGLGGAAAMALAAEGAAVAVAGRDRAALDAVAADVAAFGVRAFPVVWDLADLADVDQAVAAVEEALGPVDVLVNNTGGPPPGPAAGRTAETWTAGFEAMVVSVITLTDRVLPGMRERGWGRVVTSTSSGVIAPIPNLAISNVLRSSLLGWSKTLAGEVGPDGVTVNVVVPGRIATARTQALDEARAAREDRPVADVAAQSRSAIALRRYGRPEEFGRVVAFLASDAASYVTGSVVRVDGGYIPSV